MLSGGRSSAAPCSFCFSCILAAGRGPLTADEVGTLLGPWGNAEGLFSLLPHAEREAFSEGHRRIEEAFLPLVEKCMQKKRALRIGTNHG